LARRSPRTGHPVRLSQSGRWNLAEELPSPRRSASELRCFRLPPPRDQSVRRCLSPPSLEPHVETEQSFRGPTSSAPRRRTLWSRLPAFSFERRLQTRSEHRLPPPPISSRSFHSRAKPHAPRPSGAPCRRKSSPNSQRRGQPTRTSTNRTTSRADASWSLCLPQVGVNYDYCPLPNLDDVRLRDVARR